MPGRNMGISNTTANRPTINPEKKAPRSSRLTFRAFALGLFGITVVLCYVTYGFYR
jgi:hypothetical protein